VSCTHDHPRHAPRHHLTNYFWPKEGGASVELCSLGGVLRSDTDIAKAEREVAKLKKEMEAMQGKLDQKRVEAETLRLWKVPPRTALNLHHGNAQLNGSARCLCHVD
jgi:hypothetical protein